MRVPSRVVLALVVVGAGVGAGEGDHGGAARGGRVWSFEAGLPAEWSVRFRGETYADEPDVEERAPAPEVIELPDAAAGRHALALDVPAHALALVHTPVVAAGPGRWRVALALRGRDGDRGTLRLRAVQRTGGRVPGGTSPVVAEQVIGFGARWTPVAVAGPGADALYGELEVHGPRRVLVDAVALGPEGQELPPPAAELDVGLAEAAVRGVVDAGRPVTIAVTTSRPPSTGERIEVSAHDARGAVLPARATGPVGGGRLGFRAELRRGPAWLEARWLDGAGRTLATARRAIAVLPPMPAAAAFDADRAPLGTHTRLDPPHLASAWRLGFRWLRLHDATMVGQWITVEPTPGALFLHEGLLDRARTHGFRVLGMLEATPRAASTAPPEDDWRVARAWPPEDAAWRRYVATVVARARGRVDAWEVWNEPYYRTFWTGTPGAYRGLLASALASVPPADRALLHASGCGEPGCHPWETQALASAPAGPASTPVVDVHLYDKRLVAADEPFAARAAWTHARYGAGVRLWNTEGTVFGAARSMSPAETLGPGDAARDGGALVRWAVESLAAGMERAFAYTLVESPFASDGDLALLDADGTPRPAAVALAVLAATLGDRHFLRTTHERGATRYVFARAGGADPVTVVVADGLWRMAEPGARDVWGDPLRPRERSPVVYPAR